MQKERRPGTPESVFFPGQSSAGLLSSFKKESALSVSGRRTRGPVSETNQHWKSHVTPNRRVKGGGDTYTQIKKKKRERLPFTVDKLCEAFLLSFARHRNGMIGRWEQTLQRRKAVWGDLGWCDQGHTGRTQPNKHPNLGKCQEDVHSSPPKPMKVPPHRRSYYGVPASWGGVHKSWCRPSTPASPLLSESHPEIFSAVLSASFLRFLYWPHGAHSCQLFSWLETETDGT